MPLQEGFFLLYACQVTVRVNTSILVTTKTSAECHSFQEKWTKNDFFFPRGSKRQASVPCLWDAPIVMTNSPKALQLET